MVNLDAFHTHLDDCEKCRDNPFTLCPIGHRLLAGQLCAEEIPADIAEIINRNLWDLME